MNTIARIDYFSMLIGNAHDLAQHFANHTIRVFVEGLDRNGLAYTGGWTVKPEYNSSAGHTQYFLRVWGTLADLFVHSSNDHIGHRLITRVDVRYELLRSDRTAVRAFGQAVMDRPKGRRNIQLFDSKGREKGAEGRSTGGTGLAIGSHKSDRRVSLYTRGNSLPAVEIQLQGAAVAKMWGDHCGWDTSEIDWTRQVQNFMDAATHEADQWLADAAGLDLTQLPGALENSDGLYFFHSGQLAIPGILSAYEALSPQDKRAVRAELAQRG